MASVNLVQIPVSKVVLDVALLLCVGFPILFLYLWGTAYQRGFFCDDESLRHPYYPSTVPSIYLYLVGIGMNCAVAGRQHKVPGPHSGQEPELAASHSEPV
ncbi:hypothetical protein HHI36_000362 [Cryptolaemus montrouzieri]|uniref:Uncharacterized protein n=1 Tax=Cryptolaemus montrouzieri TaxID=559131 RepID=A0ABD2P5E8_9CUCU